VILQGGVNDCGEGLSGAEDAVSVAARATASTSSAASRNIVSTTGNCRPSVAAMTPIGLNVLGVGLAEDRADRRGDHLGVAHRRPGQFVAQEMHSGAQGGCPRQGGAAPGR
jgi:hypothetical protein